MVKTSFYHANLAKTHKVLTVVNDQHGRPTWTRTLAEFMTYLAENRKEFGYYHLSMMRQKTQLGMILQLKF